MPLEPGSTAPPFELADQDGNPVTLENLKGRRSLLVFIPFPFTGTCTGELCTIRDGLARLEALDANVVAITCDTRPANRRWADDENLNFPVLSDFWPHGRVSRAYATFNEAVGCANRTTYALDAEGIIRAVIATDSLGVAREFDAYLEALADLG